MQLKIQQQKYHILPYSRLMQWPVYFCDPKLKHSHQQLCTFLASEHKAYTTTPTRHTTTTVSQLHAVPPFECHPGCEFQVKALRAHTETVDSLTLPVADSQMPPCKHHTPSLCTWFYLQKLTKQLVSTFHSSALNATNIETWLKSKGY